MPLHLLAIEATPVILLCMWLANTLSDKCDSAGYIHVAQLSRLLQKCGKLTAKRVCDMFVCRSVFFVWVLRAEFGF